MRVPILAAALAVLIFLACGDAGEQPTAAPPPAPRAPAPPAAAPPAQPAAAASAPPSAGLPQAPPAPDALPRGLLVAISVFESGADGRPVPKSELLVLRRRDGEWQARRFEDPESNVFHKAMYYAPPRGEPGILTLGGTAAAVKLWRSSGAGLEAETLWKQDFGGRFSRMRDAEVGDLFGDGTPVIAVATHDQGVLALLRPEEGGWKASEIDRQPGKFVHEVEIGDLDADGVLELYTTPSDPNKLDGSEQHGEVVRYVPARGEGRTVVADLGTRHAKEILVEDVDGDGIDELYVSVEAAEGGSVAIRRYDKGTDPAGGRLVATLADPMCRFLTSGDVDGDGSRELVAAAKDTGLWLLRRAADPAAPWQVTAIDADSKGFEHAALLSDLDGDGSDELYAASDSVREIRRYVWTGGGFARETIHRHEGSLPLLTWNLMPFPAELLP